VRHNRLLRTTSFRLASIYVVLFTASVLILGAVVYFSVSREIRLEFDERLRAETTRLTSHFQANGLGRLAEEVRARTSEAASLDYRLEDRDGHLLAGTLPPLNAKDRDYNVGWVELAKPEAGPDADADSDLERVLVTKLDGGAVLLVGEELTGIGQARRAVMVAFAWALAATLVLGTGGGVFLSAGFLRRVDSMGRAAQGVIAGDLRQRIPAADVDDELGRLARTLNRMFDRIEMLIDANRHVSHDIAHDLRKPLARLMRRLEAARSNAASVGDYESAVDLAISDVHGVLDTFNALLRIAQIETGARRAGFKPVDLAAIAAEVASAFQPAIEDEGKTIAVDLAVALPLRGDRELLTQMIANVIENALRHTPKSACVDVRSGRRAGAPFLAICDNGLGVPEEHRSRIFERFYRVDAARATPGDGLGLSLVAAIAEIHELRITASDNRPGLRVALELSRPAGTDPAAARPQSCGRSNVTNW
jgi:signal transduction histidine kinase